MGPKRLGAGCALVAACLPLLLLVAGSSLSADRPEAFAEIHRQLPFQLRVAATLLYFPAVLAAHAAFVSTLSRDWRPLAWLGFMFFAIGNAVDAVYRNAQFFVLHYDIGARLAAAGAAEKEQLWATVSTFVAFSPAFTITFATFFGIGRLAMAWCAWKSDALLARAAGVAMAMTALQNLLPRVDDVLRSDRFAWAAQGYLWIWLAGLLLIAAHLIQNGRADRTPPAAA